MTDENLPSKTSLADKLKSLGVRTGAARLARPKPAEGTKIENLLSGEFRQTRYGESFVVEQRFPLTQPHGHISLRPAPLPAILAEWAQDARIKKSPIEKFIFFDTETSGLSGGTGTYAFMVGVGRFEGDKFVLAQFFLRDPAEEPAMLEALAEFFAHGEVLVSYNGKSFDSPLLQTRYKLHSIPVPFEDYAHLDLLHLARRLWRDRLESRSLQSIEKHIMGVTRTNEEVPGYEIPYLYFDYLRDRDATHMKGVFYHNKIDILSLAALLNHAAAMLADPRGESVQHSLDVIAIAKLFEDLKRWNEAAKLYEYGLQDSLPEDDFARAVKRLAILQRRRGDIGEAVKWWQQAAGEGHIYAHVELAKYYEHHIRDYDLAEDATYRALSLVNESKLQDYERNHWVDELSHRLERIQRKIVKSK
ncbi:MAG: ribonuclease H-like domain-containing protein [Anaerolineae bacterium]|jgi:uncharacterized protein|nr:ribonuclease H-like domain-containing protein [Anaerolineae bacterium]MBT7072579.1 ribonuclease H-like domain-containing protein [Anaerolineae bacterium]MBT7324595.1 ribonuclease H-like domain-containing protein [Anaerolineae bacterium]